MPIAGYRGGYESKDTYNGVTVPFDTLNDKTFKVLKDAGINLIIQTNQDYKTDPRQVKVALSYAEKYGIGMYVNDSIIREADNAAEIVAALQSYSQFTSFKGVFIVDEPSVADIPSIGDGQRQLSTYSDNVKLVNGFTNLNGYINLYPNSQSNRDDYASYVRAYVETCNPRVLSFDKYVWDSYYGNETAFPSRGVVVNFFRNLSDIRNESLASSIPFWSFIQAGTNWPDNTEDYLNTTHKNYVPTQGQLFWNVNMSLAYGAKGIQYFPLIQPERFAYENSADGFDFERNGLLGANGEKTKWYDYASKANLQIAEVDGVLMRSSSVRILATGSYATMASGITSNDFSGLQLGEIIADNTWGAIVGVFDYYGKEAYYVVNYDYTSAKSVTLDLPSNCQYTIVADTANCTNATSNGTGDCALELTAGGAALIVLQ